MLYPLTFQPIFKERVWGGRNLERLYGKPLPPTVPIGESWEISDRPGEASVITNGPLAGRDLHWLMAQHGREVLGPGGADGTPFPLLVKILDAREKLSLQVHPPARLAASLGGEPKTEMWYVAAAEPGADLFVGLKKGVTPDQFERQAAAGTVAECFHRLPVKAGDAMFLPSGRVHALGAGNVIFEIQQNSDTTYRVFDWNRVGLDGRPRELHLAQSLASIDFADFEPRLIHTIYSQSPTFAIRFLVDDPLFRVDAVRVRRHERFHLKSDGAQILGVLQGRLRIEHPGAVVILRPGQFVLVPASLGRVTITVEARAEFLHVQNRVPGVG